ncbi:protein unc-93 homolog A [Caerostris extrusa]|uniref:Protein unc-93 homolog A n=1 Tax=Caerostris extrusa TaxID=172846 RepID=A0AAV4XRW0_CAEEX|nr:protein unc-93 homolog A [Caerostris extrusa]
MGTTIMWGAQSTYINESSKVYCALSKKDDCHKAAKDESKGTNAENPPELSNPSNVEKLSAQDLTLKIEDIHKKKLFKKLMQILFKKVTAKKSRTTRTTVLVALIIVMQIWNVSAQAHKRCQRTQGFYTADFTKSYIGCAWSTSHIGLVTVFYGLAAAVSSLFSGYVIKFVGRRCVFAVCQAVSTINLVFMLLWKPGPQQYLLFYLAGSLWGINTGVLMAQLRAFYGVLFQGEEETAFASFNMYSGIGWTLPFIYNQYLCTSVKLYILLVLSFIGIIGYLLTEREYQMRNKNSYFMN